MCTSLADVDSRIYLRYVCQKRTGSTTPWTVQCGPSCFQRRSPVCLDSLADYLRNPALGFNLYLRPLNISMFGKRIERIRDIMTICYVHEVKWRYHAAMLEVYAKWTNGKLKCGNWKFLREGYLRTVYFDWSTRTTVCCIRKFLIMTLHRCNVQWYTSNMAAVPILDRITSLSLHVYSA